MSTHLYTVLTAEVGYLIGLFKIPDALFRMYLAWLPVVLGSDAVELLLDDCNLCGIRHISLIDSHTDCEVILIGIFQSGACRVVYRAPPLCKH